MFIASEVAELKVGGYNLKELITRGQPRSRREVTASSVRSLTKAVGKCWEKRFIGAGILSCPPEGLK